MKLASAVGAFVVVIAGCDPEALEDASVGDAGMDAAADASTDASPPGFDGSSEMDSEVRDSGADAGYTCRTSSSASGTCAGAVSYAWHLDDGTPDLTDLIAFDAAGNIVLVRNAGLHSTSVTTFAPDGTLLSDRLVGPTNINSSVEYAIAAGGMLVLAQRLRLEAIDFGGGPRTPTVYSCGYPKEPEALCSSSESYLAVYAPDGSYLWDRVFADHRFGFHHVEFDPCGNIVVVGDARGSIPSGFDVGVGPPILGDFIAAFSPTGDALWARETPDVFDDILWDSAGNLYAQGVISADTDFGGGTRALLGTQDFYVVSYTPDGAFRWDRTFGSPGVAQGNKVFALDSRERLVLAGSFSGTVDFGGGPRTAVPDITGYVASFASADGSHLWDRAFVGDRSTVRSIALDAADNIVAGGWWGYTPALRGIVDFGGGPRTWGGQRDLFITAMSSEGSYLWDFTAAAGGEEAISIVATANGQVYGFGRVVRDYSDDFRLGGRDVNTGDFLVAVTCR